MKCIIQMSNIITEIVKDRSKNSGFNVYTLMKYRPYLAC